MQQPHRFPSRGSTIARLRKLCMQIDQLDCFLEKLCLDYKKVRTPNIYFLVNVHNLVYNSKNESEC